MSKVKNSMPEYEQYLHYLNDSWYYSDETGDYHGPYIDKDDALHELERYVDYLENQNGSIPTSN